jgi:hypothetical protein
LLRRDSLIALAAGDHARAHKLLQRASLLGDVQALREAQRLEERYPDLRGGGSDTHPWKPALARAQDAESRGELRAAYSEYLRAVELGSEDALMALRALERGLHRRHFELTDQVWAGDDPVARRQLQELTDRFPEVFPPETIPRTNPETSSKPWLRWALVLLCILGAAILLARGRAIGRVR